MFLYHLNSGGIFTPSLCIVGCVEIWSSEVDLCLLSDSTNRNGTPSLATCDSTLDVLFELDITVMNTILHDN